MVVATCSNTVAIFLLPKMKLKRVVYLPGMLSLIVLPVLILYWRDQNQKEQLYVVEINMHTVDDVDGQPLARNYQVINIDDNVEENEIKLNYARLILREHKLRQDTTSGIQFHFSKFYRYESYVSVMNLLLQEDILYHRIQPRDI